MRSAYAVSYESDTQPVETVRGEFDAGDRTKAIRQAAREAITRWPKGRSFRSWVIVVERVDAMNHDVDERTEIADAVRVLENANG